MVCEAGDKAFIINCAERLHIFTDVVGKCISNTLPLC